MLPQAKLLLAIVALVFVVAGNTAAQVGRLFGTVVYSDSRVYAARGARVIAIGAYFRTETRTDGNGNFGLTLPAGTYQIYGQGVYPYTQRVNAYGYVRAGADTVISPNPLKLVHANYSAFVAIASGAGDQLGQWSDQSLGSAALNVSTINDGKLLVNLEINGPRASLAGFHVQGLGPYGKREEVTHDNGAVGWNVPAGSYTITVSKLGYVSVTARDNIVQAGRTTPVHITVNPIPGRLSGQIFISGRRAAASGFSIRFIADGFEDHTVTNESGKFDVELPPAFYKIEVTKAGYKTGVGQVTVVSGQPASVQPIVMHPGR